MQGMLLLLLQSGLPLHHHFGQGLGESFLLKLFFYRCLSKHGLHQCHYLNMLKILVGSMAFSTPPSGSEYMLLQAPTQVLGSDALMPSLHLRMVARIPQRPLRF